VPGETGEIEFLKEAGFFGGDGTEGFERMRIGTGVGHDNSAEFLYAAKLT
jgi:hypothetical protein